MRIHCVVECTSFSLHFYVQMIGIYSKFIFIRKQKNDFFFRRNENHVKLLNLNNLIGRHKIIEDLDRKVHTGENAIY